MLESTIQSIRKWSGVTCLFMMIAAASPSEGMQKIEFGPQETDITGSIKYSVIGKYKANFQRFKGEITYDSRSQQITAVHLEIEAETITSNCDWCDKIVRSEQLLDTDQHPLITFKSSEIISDGDGYRVKGTLEMHGITREAEFPFKADIAAAGDTQQETLAVNGTWQINRKDFDIIWNRVLDKGGILVGNEITVDWGIQSEIRQPKRSES